MNGSSGVGVGAVAGQVPADDVEARRPGRAARRPEGARGGADRGAEHEQRQPAVRRAGQPDDGDGRGSSRAMPAARAERRRRGTRRPRPGSRRRGRCRSTGRPCCAARRVRRRARPRSVVAIRSGCTSSPSSSSVGLGGGDDGAPEQGPQRRPLGVPGTVGALVHGLGGGEVQRGRERGCGQRGSADQDGQDRVGLVRHRRGARRRRPRTARRSRAGSG